VEPLSVGASASEHTREEFHVESASSCRATVIFCRVVSSLLDDCRQRSHSAPEMVRGAAPTTRPLYAGGNGQAAHVCLPYGDTPLGHYRLPSDHLDARGRNDHAPEAILAASAIVLARCDRRGRRLMADSIGRFENLDSTAATLRRTVGLASTNGSVRPSRTPAMFRPAPGTQGDREGAIVRVFVEGRAKDRRPPPRVGG